MKTSQKEKRKRVSSPTKEKILKVATQLFAERGFSNVSIRDISEKSGVSLPLIYYYFPNKNRLFEEVVSRKINFLNFAEELSEEVDRQKDTWDKLRRFIHIYLSRYPEEVITIGFYVKERAQIDEKGKSHLLKGFSAIRAVLENILREGIKQGVIRQIPVRLTAQTILGSMNGFLLRWIHFKERFHREKTAEFIFQLYQKSLGRDA
ncbi:MAG: TetR/AcrR family transcriptional regulator [bacterium JZ-2024 1]